MKQLPDHINEMQIGLDMLLLNLLKKGREIRDREGNVVGYSDPSAADLKVIQSRLKDCGAQTLPLGNSPLAEIHEEMKKRGLKLAEGPKLDLDEQDAASA